LVRRGKKEKKLGRAEVVRREDLERMELEPRIEMIRALIPLGLAEIYRTLEEEVSALAGERYGRKGGEEAGSRHGSNRGSVRLGGQRVPIRVPRVRGEEGEVPLTSYRKLRGSGEADEVLLRRVLYGISCRNYEGAAESIPGAIGLSSSTVSRRFVEASAEQLRAMQERDLSGEDVVAIFLDGKTFAEDTMVLALGITMGGEKRVLGFVQAGTENERVLSQFLRSLVDRGLDVSQGVLVILDGAKGLRAAVRKCFKKQALVGRCQWHKRENVVSYLPRSDQAAWRKRLQRAYERPTYAEAKEALEKLLAELDEVNQSAAASLREGLEETLTLHRLGMFGKLGRSFKTTNCLESINSQVEERCGKVDAWKNSSQKQRWLASALLDIEPRLRKVMGHKHLPALREALMKELKLDAGGTRKRAA
jgi:transposase-like protein